MNVSSFADAAFENVGKSMSFAPDAKNKSLSRLVKIEESSICQVGEENAKKYFGGKIGRKNEKMCLHKSCEV